MLNYFTVPYRLLFLVSDSTGIILVAALHSISALHAPVHGSLTLGKLHFLKLHPDLQPQLTISSQLCSRGGGGGGVAGDMSFGTSLPFSLVQPVLSGRESSGCGAWACLQIIVGSASFEYAIALHRSS